MFSSKSVVPGFAFCKCPYNSFTVLNVLEEPLEYLDVTMDRYVNVIGVSCLCQVLLEVFHVAHKQIFLAPEIFTLLSVFVKHVDCDEVFHRLGRTDLIVIMEVVKWNLIHPVCCILRFII
jgi:hypothetical protein